MEEEVKGSEICYDKITVTQNDATKMRWQGVPSFYELRDNLFATLTPISVENTTTEGN